MPGDVNHHRLITRPLGLPGYQPGRWCAVCGKTTSNKTIIDCSHGDCPNTSHTTCLGDNNTFDCCETTALREALGITAPVVYQAAEDESLEGDADPSDADSSVAPAGDDELEDLLQLEPRELVEIIRQLRVELTRKKNILSFFETTSQTLAEKRDAVVTVLDFIDNISSTRSSTEELDTRSIAATARSHSIDKEWDRQVASSNATANWWTSGKPQPLQSTTNTTTTTSSGPSHPPPPQTVTATSEGETKSVVAPTNTRNTRITENNKNNKKELQTGHSSKPVSGSTVSFRSSPRNQSRGYCKHCRRNGHTEANCLRRKKCTYCLRVGHTVEECRTRIAQEREENLFRRISTEQAQNNALIVQTLSRFLPLAHPASGPALPQPLTGKWAPVPGNQVYTTYPQPLYPDPNPAHSSNSHPPNFTQTAWSHARP